MGGGVGWDGEGGGSFIPISSLIAAYGCLFFSFFFPTGPVGVSVLTVKTDPFAVAFMKQNRIVNNCPALLTPGTFQSHTDTT